MARASSATITPLETGSERKELLAWQWPWYRTTFYHSATFMWIVLIHVTALAGLILYPLPGWPIFLGALALAWIGGIGTTVCYHRTVAHRALKLHPIARTFLIFFAVFNGSGSPHSWALNHRLHHAMAETEDDISSPRHGFFWSHMRWLWQAPKPSVDRYTPDLNTFYYNVWGQLQPVILFVSFFGGLYFSPVAFFWLGAIRLVFSFHAQMFVNSICHTPEDVPLGEDSSRNLPWLGVLHFFQGENWHKNHHARPGLARLGWTWRQPDVGYVVIRALESIGMASDVRDFRRLRAVETE